MFERMVEGDRVMEETEREGKGKGKDVGEEEDVVDLAYEPPESEAAVDSAALSDSEEDSDEEAQEEVKKEEPRPPRRFGEGWTYDDWW